MCGEGEAPTLYRESYPTAKKQHICCECGSDIDPGEKYHRVEGVWMGDFLTFKTCETCLAIRSEAESELDYPIEFECLYEVTGSEFEYAAP